MKHLFQSVTDRLFGVVPAGACVSNVGDYCYCKKAFGTNGYHTKWYVSCTGPCEPAAQQYC